jgi:regulator of sirC expression with transglutaminase-like and TPR domain
MAQASRSSVTFKLGRKRPHTFVELREPVDVAEEALPPTPDALPTSADAAQRSRRLQDEGNTIAESTGDWHKALLSWQRALELTPQRPELHETMAQAYLQLGDFWKAIACAERAF